MSGTARVFVDTNVLLYAVDHRTGAKHNGAAAWMEALWNRDAGCVSWQVLHEFYANALRKANVSHDDARAIVRSYKNWEPELPSFHSIERAWHWFDTAQISIWDALIVASAEQAGCRWLLSEDFQAGRSFGGITVVNPFEHSPTELILPVN